MPVVRNYKPGSIIYFENDKAHEIFILQSGRVVLTAHAVDTGEEVNETITSGEFFGVKSVLGKHTRESTAQVVAPSVVLVVDINEFEQMVMKNFRILLKMLKVFSNQLRRIGKKVREILQKGEPRMPATELFYIGEYYFQKGKAQQANYVYSKYLKHYPYGEFVDRAKERLDAIEKGDFTMPPEIHEEMPAPQAVSSDAEPEMPAEEIEEEEDKIEKPKSVKPVAEGIDIAKKFYEALSLFSQDKIEEAQAIYQEILSVKRFKDEATAKFAEKSQFETGRCYMKQEKFSEAIENFSNLIKKFPRTEMLKEALFNIGDCYELMNNYQKAINFYQKVVNMPPKESINSKAKKKLEQVQKKI
ncbi:MAG: tetratricopeptide repeat protein [Spirochaetes bacterium]|nr:tetratricopeptide repeat protein [Spirochaetota bacterium]